MNPLIYAEASANGSRAEISSSPPQNRSHMIALWFLIGNISRFEEGDADRVLDHSRVVEGSVRKKTNNRKFQRKSKEERMTHAEFERKEELKHLKNMKKKEIQERLEKIRAIAGIGDGGSQEEGELENSDFDKEDELLGLPKGWDGSGKKDRDM